MALTTRVWSAGKIFLLALALFTTYVVFAAAAMRLALRASEVTIPDLAGRSVNDATAALAELDLALKVEEGRRIDPNVKADHVLSQDPPAGVTARRQRTVRVWISAGPRTTRVPPLIGDSEQNAQSRLRSDAFEIESLAEIRSGRYPSGQVVAQEPPPDTDATKVSLLVNRGELGVTYVMPDVIGVNVDRASEILRSRGFRVAVVGSHPYPGVPAGVILRQHPQAGFQIAPGEPISLEVSR
jgi:serine/threonine-protein kinase